MRLNIYRGRKWKASIYGILLFFYVLISVMNASTLPVGPIYRAYNAVCVIGCFFILTRRKRETRALRRVFFAVFIVFLLSAITSKNLSMLVFAMFIITAENDFTKLVKIVFNGTLLGLLLVITLSIIKFLPDYTYDHLGKVAHSLGFYYYGSIPYYLLFISLMYIYIRKEKLKTMEIIALFALQVLSYKVFTVRLTFYISIGVLFLTLLLIKLDILNINKKIIKRLSTILFPLAGILSVYAGVSYNKSSAWWIALNSITANRISQANYAFQNYPVTLFGQQIEMHGRASIALGLYSGNYFFIDSGYIYSLLVYGLLFFLVLLLVYSLLIIKVCEINDKQLYIWLIAVLIFSFMNDALININMNPVLLCLPYLLRQPYSYR